MNNLLENIGLTLFIIGLTTAVILAFVSTWITRIKKRKLSKEAFIRFTYLIGVTSFISGAGFAISSIVGSSSEFSFMKTLMTSVFCIGVFPLAMVGVYIFDMKHYGYVAPDRQERQ